MMILNLTAGKASTAPPGESPAARATGPAAPCPLTPSSTSTTDVPLNIACLLERIPETKRSAELKQVAPPPSYTALLVFQLSLL